MGMEYNVNESFANAAHDEQRDHGEVEKGQNSNDGNFCLLRTLEQELRLNSLLIGGSLARKKPSKLSGKEKSPIFFLIGCMQIPIQRQFFFK